MSRYVMAQAGMLLTLFAFTPVPAQAATSTAVGSTAAVAAAQDNNAGRTRQASRTRSEATPDQIRESTRLALRNASVTCNLTDSRELGRTADGVYVYEAACSEGMGYVVTTASPPSALNCLVVERQAEQAREEDPAAQAPECLLPGNANPSAFVQPWAQALQIGCQVDEVAWVGRTGGGDDRYEIGCADADGYWIEVSQGGEPKSKIACLEIPAATGGCRFTTPAEQAGGIQAMLAGSPAADCAAAEARFMGGNQNGRFYELKCASGAGQVVRLSQDGAFQQAYDCAQAANIGDGCTLTDAATAVAAQAEARAARLAELGFTCSITQQRVIGAESSTGSPREVSEYQCSDKPLGMVTLLPATGSDNAEQWDCLTAKARGVTCQYTTDDQLKAALGQMLQADGKSCQVAEFRISGGMATAAGEVIEVKCDGGQGYIAEFPATRQSAGQVQTCAQSAAAGEACRL